MDEKLILVADDDEDIRNMLKTVFDSQGYRVQTAADGKEALAAIGREKPDLVVLDLKMPRLNGYHLFAQLKSDDYLKKIPVIVITGVSRDSEFDDKEWAERMGAEGFLTKPFDLEELGRRVNELATPHL